MELDIKILKSVWKFINFKKEPIYIEDIIYLTIFIMSLMVISSVLGYIQTFSFN